MKSRDKLQKGRLRLSETVTKEERVSQERILVPSAWNILMLRARRHVQEKDTRGKFLHGSRCQVTEERSATRLAYKECFKGSVESNMELTLGQRCKDETHKCN
jgi:hypothetical protein